MRIAAPSTTADGDRRDDEDLAPADARRSLATRSATIRLRRDPDRRDEHLAGEARAARRQQAGLGSMEGDREVGADDGLATGRPRSGRPRSAYRPRRSGTFAARGPGGRPRRPIGSGRAARRARRSRAGHRPRSTPARRRARGPAGRPPSTAWMRVTRGSRSSRSQLRPASGVVGRAARRHEHRRDLGAGPGQVAGRHEPVAAVVAGPAQDRGSGPSSSDRSPRAIARTAAATAAPACSMSRWPGTPIAWARLSAPAIASAPIGARAAAPAQRRRRPRRSSPISVGVVGGQVLGRVGRSRGRWSSSRSKRSRGARRPEPRLGSMDRSGTLLYDADCGLCVATATWLEARVPAGSPRTAPAPAGRLGCRASPRSSRAATSPSSCTSSGPTATVLAGARAALAVGRLVPILGLYAALLDRPLGHRLLEPLYREIASHRRRIGRLLGLPAECPLPTRTAGTGRVRIVPATLAGHVALAFRPIDRHARRGCDRTRNRSRA